VLLQGESLRLFFARVLMRTGGGPNVELQVKLRTGLRTFARESSARAA